MSSSLLPSLQAADLRRALTDYLSTTFALTDDEVRTALEDFLTDGEHGIFRGPYVRLRLPFRPASGTWAVPLDWWPDDFTPYRHQAAAFERLSGKHHPPEPTIVTTGTGSGKTESFLVPILDHVLRARSAGKSGIKALILYPMNALANDQAQRIARLLTTDPRLAGVTAGLYIGPVDSPRTMVSADGLINDRDVMQSEPPDVLLTNYKMLDQLLLRAKDSPLWRLSRASLRYLVLDEFHTYDGAQGTDVAMLLRRLGLVLGVARPDRPLGDITPVATSATLGTGDTAAIRDFAATVFGRPFPPDSVVTEERLTVDEWCAEQEPPDPRDPVQARPVVESEAVAAALQAVGPDPIDVVTELVRQLFERREGSEAGVELSTADARRLVDGLSTHANRLSALVVHHPRTTELLARCARPAPLPALAASTFPADRSPQQEDGLTILDAYFGLLSLIRVRRDEGADSRFLSTDVQLWVREVSRVDRAADTTVRFRWSDDGVDSDGVLYLPAIYCRHCGRSGWAVLAAPAGRGVDVDPARVRGEAVRDNRQVRNLIYAGPEAAAALDASRVDGVQWLDPLHRELLSERPDDEDLPVAEAPVIPVLATGDNQDRRAADLCPACDRADGIRFLGSGIATLASVSLSTLFSSPYLDSDEKKSLVFTDSVQDAAHRAGFVQARSHVLTLRGALRRALGDDELTLTELVAQAMQDAGDDSHRRYALVPPALADQAAFRAYYDQDADRGAERTARGRVSRRLAFDATLEFGLSSRTGRTLELTSSVAVEVVAGTTAQLARFGHSARQAAEKANAISPELDGQWATVDDRALTGWVRGVLERIRTQGGIAHPWLERYVTDDGTRFHIWGGRDRRGGMPAFPSGRAAPSFPTTAPSSELLSSLGSAQSWWARWAQRCLTVSGRDGAVLSRALLDTLDTERILQVVLTKANHRVYLLPPEHIVLSPTEDDDLAHGRHRLRCTVCQSTTPGTASVVDQLVDGPCLRALCPGTLRRSVPGADYYRRLYSSPSSRRVVAAEHTGLLPDPVRLERETAFKSGRRPSDPNVLVATPTLELGIDIGDLSTVVLASLPRAVAAYQQRIGRAGRRTGNALVLAFASGRGLNLPRLAEPLSVIDGVIQPPATYLDAVEILQRQYVAHLIDRQAGDPEATAPGRAASDVLETWAEGSWAGTLLADGRVNAAAYVEEFLGQFGPGVREDTADDLRAWAGADATADEITGLEALFHRACVGWRAEREEVKDQIVRTRDSLAELDEQVAQPSATDETRLAQRTTRAELGSLRARQKLIKDQYWINALEERGVLPNYTLLDDTVTLDVAVSWFDSDAGEFRDEPRAYQRGSRVALTEFAPGSVFYAQGVAARIDAVELRAGGQDRVEDWTLCPRCGWGAVGSDVPTTCPRCADPGVLDAGQRLRVLPLDRVSARVSRDEDAIADATEDRTRTYFATVTAADIDPADITEAWRVADYPFGAEYIRKIDIRWLNLGRARVSGRDRVLAGVELQAPLFRACPGCGVVPAAQRRDEQAARHRGWCALKKELEIEWEEIALGRTLRTQAVRLLVPPQYTTDLFAAVSFRAALLLGLREVIGGDPDHLDVVDVHAPVNGVDRLALLLHDIVPGGTGYLADFARPDRVRDMLQAALDVVAPCPCAEEGKLACHRCLLPFVAPSQVDRASRARAAQMLSEILGDADGAWATVKAESIADVPPPSPESHLEQRFRDVLAEALKSRGADVTQTPLPEGTKLDITLHGATTRRWTLRPQVDQGGVRPDFLLTTQDPSVPQVCIFTDGAAYHASAAHNRVADDAVKRAKLRSVGFLVWALTSSDLDTSQTSASPGPLEAVSATGVRAVRSRILPGSASPDLLRQDALSQLLAWMSAPDAAAWSKLGDVAALAFHSMPGSQRSSAARGDAARLASAALRDETFAPAGNELGAWRATYSTGLGLAGLMVREKPLQLEAALVLDDRESTLTSPAGQAAWRELVRLSNVLGAASQSVDLTTLTAGSTASLAAKAPVIADDVPPGVSPEWQAAVAGALGDDERELLLALAAHAVPVPVQGFEDEGGVPIDLAWPDLKVAVSFDGSAGGMEPGWTLLAPDANTIVDRIAALAAEGKS